MAYRSGFMMASMGIAYAGVDGTILEVNPAFASMLGYSADQRHKLIGRTLFSLSTPQDMQVILPRVLLELHASLPRVQSPCCPFQSLLHVVRDSIANFSIFGGALHTTMDLCCNVRKRA